MGDTVARLIGYHEISVAHQVLGYLILNGLMQLWQYRPVGALLIVMGRVIAEVTRQQIKQRADIVI